MNVFRLVLCLAGLAVCLLVKYVSGSGFWPKDRQEAPATEEKGSLGPVLVFDRWEYKGQVVAVESIKPELAYAVSTKDGGVVADHLTVRDLQRRFPEIYDFMLTGRVFGARSSREVLVPDCGVGYGVSPGN